MKFKVGDIVRILPDPEFHEHVLPYVGIRMRIWRTVTDNSGDYYYLRNADGSPMMMLDGKMEAAWPFSAEQLSCAFMVAMEKK